MDYIRAHGENTLSESRHLGGWQESLPLLALCQVRFSFHRGIAPTSCCGRATSRDGARAVPASSNPTAEMPHTNIFPDQYLTPHAVRVNLLKKHEKTEKEKSVLSSQGLKLVFSNLPPVPV